MQKFNNMFIRLVAVTMVFTMVIALTGCVVEPPVMKVTEYTVTVTNLAGTPLEKCKVDVYTDDSMTGVVYTGITDKNGQIRFTDVAAVDKYVAAVSKVHPGYDVADSYPLTGERTQIVLKPGVLTDEDMDSVRYSLGDPVMDFSVMTPDGEMVLSQLLQEKKAVVLNFWFLNCDPCKMEFPYIQEGYERVGEDVAILALNPYDGTQEDVVSFRETKGYEFTMSKCDARWADMMKLQSYPTTVIIDRYGHICLIHSGMLRNTQEFLDMVEYFTADDYKQQFFRNAGQIPAV
jgi:thiol-disulfide isomerase/thioredoxin